MKKVIYILLLGIMAVLAGYGINGKIGAEKAAEEKIERIYKMHEFSNKMDIAEARCEAVEDFIGEIYGGYELYNTYELTAEILESRTEENIIVEVAVGSVLNENLDGESYGYYISYRSVENAKPGDTVITYFVYNPYNNYVDDIVERFDIIV